MADGQIFKWPNGQMAGGPEGRRARSSLFKNEKTHHTGGSMVGRREETRHLESIYFHTPRQTKIQGFAACRRDNRHGLTGAARKGFGAVDNADLNPTDESPDRTGFPVRDMSVPAERSENASEGDPCGFWWSTIRRSCGVR